MAKEKRKKDTAPQETAAPSGKVEVTARIVTDRGPFRRGKPLRLNEVVVLSAAVFATLQDRGWAERV
jgi:hypothetical protein